MEQLIRDHGKAVYGLCRKLTATKFDADDLYQQTFLVAMGKDFREDGNPRALLTKICIAQWKNEQRKLFRRQRIVPETDVETEHVAAEGSLTIEVEKKEQYETVRRIVASLEERCRLPVILYYGMEFSLGEIAKILHCPEGTVKSRLSAARKAIRKELEVKGYDRQAIG